MFIFLTSLAVQFFDFLFMASWRTPQGGIKKNHGGSIRVLSFLVVRADFSASLRLCG
jgi:hypothetical protein